MNRFPLPFFHAFLMSFLGFGFSRFLGRDAFRLIVGRRAEVGLVFPGFLSLLLAGKLGHAPVVARFHIMIVQTEIEDGQREQNPGQPGKLSGREVDDEIDDVEDDQNDVDRFLEDIQQDTEIHGAALSG